MNLKRIMRYVEEHAQSSPDAPAILAPGRLPVTYARLNEAVRGVSAYLSNRGLGPHNRVAVLLPDGVEFLLAFLAVSNVATCVPLDHNFTKDEFKSYLELSKAKALLVQDKTAGPAALAAQRLGIP